MTSTDGVFGTHRLSTAKWDVINILEKRLPATPFTDEWRNIYPDEQLPDGDERPMPIRRRDRLAGWWRHTKHREATAVEQIVPFVFVVVYLVLLVRVVVQ